MGQDMSTSLGKSVAPKTGFGDDVCMLHHWLEYNEGYDDLSPWQKLELIFGLAASPEVRG